MSSVIARGTEKTERVKTHGTDLWLPPSSDDTATRTVQYSSYITGQQVCIPGTTENTSL